MLLITWQELALTIPSESFPKAITCTTREETFSGDIIYTKVLKDLTASIFTSTSGSLSKCP
jgi:hypothetical protein